MLRNENCSHDSINFLTSNSTRLSTLSSALEIPPLTAINDLVDREVTAKRIRVRGRRNKTMKVVDVVDTVGIEGWRRIAERAIDNLYGRKIRELFKARYALFRAEHEQRRRAGGNRRRRTPQDALTAFAKEILDVDRATANRYLNGVILRTPAPDLDRHLMRCGSGLHNIAPSPDEKLIAVLSATAAAMLKARGLEPGHILLTLEDVRLIRWLMENAPVSPEAFDDPVGWKWYLRYRAELSRAAVQYGCLASGSDKGISLEALTVAGDWQAAKHNRWLGWQLAIAVLFLERASAVNGDAGCLGSHSEWSDDQPSKQPPMDDATAFSDDACAEHIQTYYYRLWRAPTIRLIETFCQWLGMASYAPRRLDEARGYYHRLVGSAESAFGLLWSSLGIEAWSKEQSDEDATRAWLYKGYACQQLAFVLVATQRLRFPFSVDLVPAHPKYRAAMRLFVRGLKLSGVVQFDKRYRPLPPMIGAQAISCLMRARALLSSIDAHIWATYVGIATAEVFRLMNDRTGEYKARTWAVRNLRQHSNGPLTPYFIGMLEDDLQCLENGNEVNWSDHEISAMLVDTYPRINKRIDGFYYAS